ncbi:MAG: hypothetical protein V1668_03555 [Patescibacteria group bacterium]
MKTARFFSTVLLAAFVFVGIMSVQLGCDKHQNPVEPTKAPDIITMVGGSNGDSATQTEIGPVAASLNQTPVVIGPNDLITVTDYQPTYTQTVNLTMPDVVHRGVINRTGIKDVVVHELSRVTGNLVTINEIVQYQPLTNTIKGVSIYAKYGATGLDILNSIDTYMNGQEWEYYAITKSTKTDYFLLPKKAVAIPPVFGPGNIANLLPKYQELPSPITVPQIAGKIKEVILTTSKGLCIAIDVGIVLSLVSGPEIVGVGAFACALVATDDLAQQVVDMIKQSSNVRVYFKRIEYDGTTDPLILLISTPIPNPQPIFQLDILPNTQVELMQGETKQFNAYPRDASGNIVGAPVSWSTTFGTIDANGLYSATTVGQGTVTASLGSAWPNVPPATVKVVVTAVIANRPPIVSVPASASATINMPITINITKSDPDGNAVQIAVDPGNQTVEWVQGTSYTHTFNVVGVYNVRFTGYDGKAWSPTAICVVTVAGPANRPPVVSVPPTVNATINVPVTINIIKSDPDGNVVQIAVDPGDQTGIEWVQGNSYIHTFKAAGMYNVRFTGHDGKAWSPTAICVVTVAGPANTAPTACMSVSPQNGSGTTASVFTFTSCSTDPETPVDALQVRWQIDGVWTAWTTLKTQTKQWTTVGQKTVVLEVRDAGGLTAQATKTVIVNPPLNNPPTVSVASTTTGQVGATTVIPYTASDRETPSANLCVAVDWLDGSAAVYFWGGAPATYIFKSAGTYDVRFTAWDGTDWSPTAICRVTVTSGCSNMPTLLGPINGQTVSLSAGFSFYWTKVCDGFGEYNLYVMTAPNSTGKTVFAERMTPTYTSLGYWGSGLLPNTTYYWCLQMGNFVGAPLTPFASFRTAP